MLVDVEYGVVMDERCEPGLGRFLLATVGWSGVSKGRGTDEAGVSGLCKGRQSLDLRDDSFIERAAMAAGFC